MKGMKQASENEGGDFLRGLAAGIIGGVVASVAMNQFQKLVGRLIADKEEAHGAQSLQKGHPTHGIGLNLRRQHKDEADDDATDRLANAIGVAVLDRELTDSEKYAAGTALHYGYGISMGAVYGVAAEFSDVVTTGAGMPYGALLWIGADEVVVPALGLSKSPTEYPLSIHAYALSSHLVYGLTLEMTRRAVRNIL